MGSLPLLQVLLFTSAFLAFWPRNARPSLANWLTRWMKTRRAGDQKATVRFGRNRDLVQYRYS